MPFFFLFGILFFLSHDLKAQQTKHEAIVHQQVLRNYITYIPANYTGKKAVPIVLNFHGLTMSATVQMELGDFRSIADTAGFLIIHPQGLVHNGQTHWNIGGITKGSQVDDLGFVNRLLDTLIKEYNVDTIRIYSTGYSNGGGMSHLLACQLSDRIAAIASVAGTMTFEVYDSCNAQRPVPVLQIHGTNDQSSKYDGSTWGKKVVDVLNYWARSNNCTNDTTWSNLPNKDTTDNSTVQKLVYNKCDDCSNVVHYKIINGSHSWPGSRWANNDISSSEVIWEFFRNYDINGCVTAGIINNEKPDLFSVYPNPSTGLVQVKTDKKVFDVNVYSLDGRLITSMSNTKIIDLKLLTAGTYILRFTTSGYSSTKRITIK
ncbi:MAG: T9SS type A sorting domain-containing protein [Bacteroidia bacterium]